MQAMVEEQLRLQNAKRTLQDMGKQLVSATFWYIDRYFTYGLSDP